MASSNNIDSEIIPDSPLSILVKELLAQTKPTSNVPEIARGFKTNLRFTDVLSNYRPPDSDSGARFLRLIEGFKERYRLSSIRAWDRLGTATRKRDEKVKSVNLDLKLLKKLSQELSSSLSEVIDEIHPNPLEGTLAAWEEKLSAAIDTQNHSKIIPTVQRILSLPAINLPDIQSTEKRIFYRGVLASSYYLYGEVDLAQDLTESILRDINLDGNQSARSKTALAQALFIRGSCRATKARSAVSNSISEAHLAVSDLEIAQQIFIAESEFNQDFKLAARICEVGSRSLDFKTLHHSNASSIMNQALKTYSSLDNNGLDPEEIGWLCIYEVENLMATNSSEIDPNIASFFIGIFNNKAEEIARRFGNWDLLSRAFYYDCWINFNPNDYPFSWKDEVNLHHLTGAISRFKPVRIIWEDYFKTLRKAI